MNSTRSYRSRATLIAILAGLFAGQPAPADTTYQYTDPDGTPLFTDRPPNSAETREHEFVGYYGRPPARASCIGVDDARMRERAQRIDDPLLRNARRHDIEPTLVRAIIAVESCFDPAAVSRVGAQGLMQLMPQTAASLGVTDSFNIEDNIRGGIRYFAELRERYGGDTVLALAAYNAGPEAVDRHGGIPPYRETQNYIQRVLDHWQIYRDRALE